MTETTLPQYAKRCDRCGKFTRVLHDIPTNPPEGGIDHQECSACFGECS